MNKDMFEVMVAGARAGEVWVFWMAMLAVVAFSAWREAKND